MRIRARRKMKGILGGGVEIFGASASSRRHRRGSILTGSQVAKGRRSGNHLKRQFYNKVKEVKERKRELFVNYARLNKISGSRSTSGETGGVLTRAAAQEKASASKVIDGTEASLHEAS